MKTDTVDNWSSRNRRNTRLLAYWTVAWTASTALATFGPLLLWGETQRTITVLAIMLNICLGVAMLLANKRYLQGLDELQQKIQMQASTLTLGVMLVAGIAYSIMDLASLLPLDEEISFLILLGGATYLVSIVLFTRFYR